MFRQVYYLTYNLSNNQLRMLNFKQYFYNFMNDDIYDIYCQSLIFNFFSVYIYAVYVFYDMSL